MMMMIMMMMRDLWIILSSPVPKIFSVKLHRILFKFVLVE